MMGRGWELAMESSVSAMAWSESGIVLRESGRESVGRLMLSFVEVRELLRAAGRERVRIAGAGCTESVCAPTMAGGVRNRTNKQMFKSFRIIFCSFRISSYLCKRICKDTNFLRNTKK